MLERHWPRNAENKYTVHLCHRNIQAKNTYEATE